jgi:hypothetical protein
MTLAAAAACAVATLSPALAAAPPARLQVTADEYRLTLSRSAIRGGPAVIELLNLGEDDHDLALRRQVKGARTIHIRTVSPGRHRDVETRLAAGRYALWCTLADHRARGMRATLVVRG